MRRRSAPRPWPTLERYCRCVAGAVGVLSVRVFGAQASDRDAGAVALGDALQLTNILRDLAEDAASAASICRASSWIATASRATIRRACCAILACRRSAGTWRRAQQSASMPPTAGSPGRAPAGAPGADHARRLPSHPRAAGCRRLAAARSAGPPRQGGAAVGRDPPRPALSAMARVHIVGAGLAGLAAAVRLTLQGRQVVLYEAAQQAGGRCRSDFDRTLGRVIDNGNHLLLSGNRSAMAYLDAIGARDSLMGPPDCSFPFMDLATGSAGWCGPIAVRCRSGSRCPRAACPAPARAPISPAGASPAPLPARPSPTVSIRPIPCGARYGTRSRRRCSTRRRRPARRICYGRRSRRALRAVLPAAGR